MKKLTLLFGVLLLCSVFSSSVLKAQTFGGPFSNHFVIEDLGDPLSFNDPCIPLDELCRTNELFFTIRVVNYPQYSWSDNGESLPPFNNPQAPMPYVRYTINGSYQSIVKLDAFVVDHGPYYAMTVSMGQFPSVITCQMADESIVPIVVSLELLAKDSPNTYIPYPTSFFSGPNQLFECAEYDEEENCPVLTTNTGILYICCDDCGLEFREERGEEDTANEFQVNMALWSVQPNPFNDNLMVEYAISKESNVTISLFNLSGQQVFETNQVQQSGDHQTRINTAHLPNGIYHCRIHTTDGMVTKKVIKMD